MLRMIDVVLACTAVARIDWSSSFRGGEETVCSCFIKILQNKEGLGYDVGNCLQGWKTVSSVSDRLPLRCRSELRGPARIYG